MKTFFFFVFVVAIAFLFAQFQKDHDVPKRRPPWRFKPWPPKSAGPDAVPDEAGRPVRIATPPDMAEAQVQASLLRGFGVDVQVRTHRGGGPIELYVDEADVAAARDLLENG